MATAEALLTAEEYRLLPDSGVPTELVRGRIVPLNMPFPRHGEICSAIVILLGTSVKEQGLGRLVSNDSGVITERDPDTVRGADVAFYSYERVPRGPVPEGYLPVIPELVFEVRSPGDRWRNVLAKVVEYLGAGVTAVCVLDPGPQRAHVYYADEPEQIFAADEELALPAILGDLRVTVRQFFE
jgi:Uma2 family endonuclease